MKFHQKVVYEKKKKGEGGKEGGEETGKGNGEREEGKACLRRPES